MSTHSSSWLPIPHGSHFSLSNIPFGVISHPKYQLERHIAIAIGEHALDLHVFSRRGGFRLLSDVTETTIKAFYQPTLNEFAALGRAFHRAVRGYIQQVFASNSKAEYQEILLINTSLQKEALFLLVDVSTHLPMKIGAYTDFFAGKNHAYNCGCIFRDPDNALQPNYLHLPVGYSSRSSSVVPSGTVLHRPQGQFLENPAAAIKKPVFGPCRRLDIELELGVFLCKANPLGTPIDVNEAAADYIFGMVILNDWSARDIQAWEAVPLGPFNAKNFASSISTWVVLADALEPFKAPGIENETELLPYLMETDKNNVFNINLEVTLTTSLGECAVLTKTNGANLVFSFAQMIAHHTVGGCPLEVGDLIGSGTISGTEPGTFGSLLEASKGGTQVHCFSNGVKRLFLEDGDTVKIEGWCGNADNEDLVGFGTCEGRIAPAIPRRTE